MHDDSKAQVFPRASFPTASDDACLTPFRSFAQATLHRVLRHLVLHRHRLAAIEAALARDRAAAAAAEAKLGQALSVQPTVDMSYKQTRIQQHQLASTIDNFASQVRFVFCNFGCSCIAATSSSPHLTHNFLSVGGPGTCCSSRRLCRSSAHRSKRPESRRTH
jgi:hypothetical protein